MNSIDMVKHLQVAIYFIIMKNRTGETWYECNQCSEAFVCLTNCHVHEKTILERKPMNVVNE